MIPFPPQLMAVRGVSLCFRTGRASWFRRNAQWFWAVQGRKTATELIDVQREPLLNVNSPLGQAPDQRGDPPGQRSTQCPASWRAPSAITSPRRSLGRFTFPDSKARSFSPRRGSLLCVLLLVPTRHWWAYVLAAASAHFLATQQADWPPNAA